MQTPLVPLHLEHGDRGPRPLPEDEEDLLSWFGKVAELSQLPENRERAQAILERAIGLGRRPAGPQPEPKKRPSREELLERVSDVLRRAAVSDAEDLIKELESRLRS